MSQLFDVKPNQCEDCTEAGCRLPEYACSNVQLPSRGAQRKVTQRARTPKRKTARDQVSNSFGSKVPVQGVCSWALLCGSRRACKQRQTSQSTGNSPAVFQGRGRSLYSCRTKWLRIPASPGKVARLERCKQGSKQRANIPLF